MKFIFSVKATAVVCTSIVCGIGNSMITYARTQNQQSVTEEMKVSAQRIAENFLRIRTMTGDFVQFSPRGAITQGTFYLERPGKIRFTYKDSPIRIISDGKSVVINNKKLDTWSLYQFQQTPMNIFLSDKINLTAGQLLEFRQDPEAITMVIAYGGTKKSKIRMIFSPKTYELRQWTIIDRQNLETTVQLVNSRTGVHFTDGMFDIDYERISMKRRKQ